MVGGEADASGVGSSEATSRFDNSRTEVASGGDLASLAKFADETVSSGGTSDVEPHTLHGDAHLVFTGRVGGLGDDGRGVPVGECTSDTVAASVGSTTLPEGSRVGVGFGAFSPLPESSGVLSATKPARGCHLSGDEVVFAGTGNGGEVTRLTGVDLFRAELAGSSVVTRHLEVAVDVAVGGVVVSARAGGPGDGAEVSTSRGGEVVDGLQDGGVELRSASTFEAELTEGGEPHLDDTKVGQVGEVGAEEIHATRVAIADGDSQAIKDAVGVLDGNTDEGLHFLATGSVGEVTSSSGVVVAVGVGAASGATEFSTFGSFRDAHASDPSATVTVSITVGLRNIVARVVSSDLTLALVPDASSLLGAVHGSERGGTDTILVGVAGLRFEELGGVASSATSEGLLDDGAFAVGAATTAVD